MAKKKKYYVVWEGRVPGVYDNWDDCLEQIEYYPKARYRSFLSPEEAAEAFRAGFARAESIEIGNLLSNSTKHAVKAQNEKTGGGGEIPVSQQYKSIPEIDCNAWAVDASCLGNPGVMEYRGVDLASGKELFKVGPFKGGTNNIGEFLAIVHALALMAQRKEHHNIYSDSQIGISWVKKKCVRTSIQPNEENAKLFDLMRRAIVWLNTHSYTSRLMKWQTDIWGEIPADFDRK